MMGNSEELGKVLNGKSRNIPKNTGLALWAKSAGRCQICGSKLYENEKFGLEINISQQAHIHAFSKKGSRHTDEIIDVHSIDNLMLLCYEDHHTIDNKPEQFTVELLQGLKADFENKVASVVDIIRKKTSVIYYSSNISELDSSPKTKNELNRALLDFNLFSDGHYYPIESPIPSIKQDDAYFKIQKAILKSKLMQIKSALDEAEVVSVFAIAPQPLLMYLGYLLNDESDTRIFQKFRGGDSSWSWKSDQLTTTFHVDELFHNNLCNSNEITEVNLIVSISAEIAEMRIHSAVSQDIPTYVLRSSYQGFDAIKSNADVNEFTKIFRNEAIEKIRQQFPKASIINIFPAMPVSLPVRMGMDYQKNVDIEWRIFNHNNEDGFIYATSITGGNQDG